MIPEGVQQIIPPPLLPLGSNPKFVTCSISPPEGRGVGLERKTPPQGYICHRCKVPGHFIQHCPTNGDPNYDIKRVKPPIGIPKSMLMATPEGSYALPSRAVAVLRLNDCF
ncbi:hypothetical protein H6P81_007138 [Aristolochia fimbriata]|uniref:Zinc knuckle CX2CX3GHX4C domain-containing protein n=1 Tax=Aristolochia fimbriata TaxID=158543 RepID=A0AAV7F0F5_ARIFI|nr:hypothetical protein H6P81_007138 [Aristolochia fimbriata]